LTSAATYTKNAQLESSARNAAMAEGRSEEQPSRPVIADILKQIHEKLRQQKLRQQQKGQNSTPVAKKAAPKPQIERHLDYSDWEDDEDQFSETEPEDMGDEDFVVGRKSKKRKHGESKVRKSTSKLKKKKKRKLTHKVFRHFRPHTSRMDLALRSSCMWVSLHGFHSFTGLLSHLT
jgi:hypothetical protein